MCNIIVLSVTRVQAPDPLRDTRAFFRATLAARATTAFGVLRNHLVAGRHRPPGSHLDLATATLVAKAGCHLPRRLLDILTTTITVKTRHRKIVAVVSLRDRHNAVAEGLLEVKRMKEFVRVIIARAGVREAEDEEEREEQVYTLLHQPDVVLERLPSVASLENHPGLMAVRDGLHREAKKAQVLTDIVYCTLCTSIFRVYHGCVNRTR